MMVFASGSSVLRTPSEKTPVALITARARTWCSEPDVALFKVTNPAVHEFGAATGSSFGKVVLLHHQRAVPARGRVDGDAETRRSPAEDEQVPGSSRILNLTQYPFAFPGNSSIFGSA